MKMHTNVMLVIKHSWQKGTSELISETSMKELENLIVIMLAALLERMTNAPQKHMQ